MRTDPESGTALAYYLGQHPDDSKRIANSTLANNEKEWASALMRAGIALGEIKAKLPAPGAKKAAAPAPSTPTTKKVTSASKPPTPIRGVSSAPAAFELLNESDAKDVGKWTRAREAQLAKSGKR